MSTRDGPSNEPHTMKPTPEMVVRKGQPRGLWKELARIDGDNRGRDFWDSREAGLGMLLRFIEPLIMETGGELNAVLEPYDDATLLEQHGADVFDLFVRLASEELWGQWIFLLLEVSASGRSAIAFQRLFPLCPEEIWSDQHNIINLLRRVVIVGHNTEVLSTLLEIDGALPLPSGFVRDLVEGAVRGGSVEVMSTLLAVDSVLSQVQEVDDAGYSSLPILSIAAFLGGRSMVAALIKAGAPLEFQSRRGRPPLATAVASDRDEALGIVRDLLAVGADVNNVGHNDQTKGPFGNSPLCLAAAKNKEGMMDLLLAAGADLGNERVDILPLHAAAHHHSCGALQRLISAGASVHQLDSRGRSALHVACLHNCEGAVKLLLQYNARVTLLCDGGLSPFDVVAMAVLNRRQLNRCWGLRRRPSTLNSNETSVADRILEMLRRASAWERRGWLVLMRHRIAHDPLAAGSSSRPPSFVESEFGDQTATPHDSETKEDANDGGCELSVHGDIDLAGASPRGTAPSEAIEGRSGHAFTLETPAVDSSSPNGGGKVQVCESLRCAVEWLVQCPDEVGIFRETLAFL
ncbi:ankyrin repeat protein [Ectocarpus siliculosus]|uniref:Ankyrin repeat protein n=1 Tax=Ectocarpus siliculosus TaxID=2880 RepID=D7G6J8_ECTSI|nr:ankyrin repeat protein [Ectocarpus siliculosus]|eukprot:CBJ27583.1 ankyrin repeat protein [Ectocarpus siliculosus]